MVLFRYRARSLAGVPFQFQGHSVSCEGNDIDLSEYDARFLAQVRVVEVRDPHGTLLPREVVPQRPRMRVRVRPGHRPTVYAGGHAFGSDIYVVDENAALSAHPLLEVRPHDEARFPSRVEIRARLRAGHAPMRVGSLSVREEWVAHSVPFDELTTLRFSKPVEVEFLDKRDEPPLMRVVVEGYRASRFADCGFEPDLDAEDTAVLYPREVERLGAFTNLRLRVLPTPLAELSANAQLAETMGPIATATDARATSTEGSVAMATHLETVGVHEGSSDAETMDAVENVGTPPGTVAAHGNGADLPASGVRSAIERWTRDPETRRAAFGCDGFTVHEIANRALGVPSGDVTRSLQMQIASALRDLGWEHLPLCWRGQTRVRPYRPRLE